MRPFSYHRAADVDDAIAVKKDGEAKSYLAGGTTLIDLVKLDVLRPAQVVDVNRLPMDKIEDTPQGGLRIGANARNSDLAWDERVKRNYAALSEALLSGASPQLRNMATVAGNFMQRTRCQYYRDNFSPCNKRQPGSGCAALGGYNRSHAVLGGSEHCVATHPSDMCVAMAIFDAKLVVTSGRGVREIAARDFHLLPGDSPSEEFALRSDELITAVILPPPPTDVKTVYLKSRDRAAYEFALASAAVMLGIKDGAIRVARVGLGGVGTKPWRASEAEALLEGKAPTEDVFRDAAEAALADAKPLEHNAFKIPLAKNVLQRALSRAAGG